MALVVTAFGLALLLGPAIGGVLSNINLLDYSPQWATWGIIPFPHPPLYPLPWQSLIDYEHTFSLKKRFLKKKGNNIKKEDFQILAPLHVENPGISRTNLIYFIFTLSFSGLKFTLHFLATERFNYDPTHVGYLFLYIGFILLLIQGFLMRRLTPYFQKKILAH